MRRGQPAKATASQTCPLILPNFFPSAYPTLSEVFSDPALGAGKVTLRPKPVARVEEATSGVSMLKPHWWEAFENYLHLNNSDIQAKCSQCSSKAA
jgi:hypothetical protein